MPVITMDIMEFTEITDRVKALEAENGQLRVDVAAARLEKGGDGLAKLAVAALRTALPAVRFAVGNLDPETIRGWPWMSLVDLAECLRTLPVRTQDEIELAGALKEFAKEAEYIDHMRRLGRHKELEKQRRTEAGGTTVDELLRDQDKQVHERFGGTPPMTAPQSPADAVRGLFETAAGITVTPVTPEAVETDDDKEE